MKSASQPSPNLPPFNFPSEVCPVYAIAPSADADDVRSLLEAKMAHLEALLMMTYGEGGESFRSMRDDLQDNYMWSCCDMATEIRELFQQLAARRAAQFEMGVGELQKGSA